VYLALITNDSVMRNSVCGRDGREAVAEEETEEEEEEVEVEVEDKEKEEEEEEEETGPPGKRRHFICTK